MTISDTVRANFTGDATAGPKSFSFKIADESDLIVVVRDVTDSSDKGTPLVLNATNGYTVAGVGIAAGGSITLTGTYATSVTSDFKGSILHRAAFTQTLNTRNSSTWNNSRAGLEDALDKLVALCLYLEDQSARSLVFGASMDDAAPDAITNGELPLPVASAFMRRNAANNGWEFTQATDGSITFPAVNVDNAHIRADGTDGLTYQASLLIEDDSGNFSGFVNITMTGDLLDGSGNELIKLTATASAVNEFTVTNAATGGGPTLSATGDDTNIDINITPKGSGQTSVTGNIAVTGTVDGRDVAADGTKLDGIASGAVADHGALSGLSDDDHTQYVLADGSRNITGTQTFGASVVVDGTTDATSTTTGSLQTDGGLGVVKKAYFGDNVFDKNSEWIASRAPDIIITNSQAENVDGGDATSGSWLNITLNTEDRDVNNDVTLSSNVLSGLPAGDWYVRWRQHFFDCGDAKTRLRNETDGTTHIVGETIKSNETNPTVSFSYGSGVFTQVAGKDLGVEYRVQTTISGNGLGNGRAWGETEVYGRLELWRLS